jgi:hypothetical protein
LKVNDKKDPEPDPLVRGTYPRIRIRRYQNVTNHCLQELDPKIPKNGHDTNFAYELKLLYHRGSLNPLTLDAKLLGCHIRGVAEASPSRAPVSRLHHPVLRDILNNPTAEATRAFTGNARTAAVAGRRSRRQRRTKAVPMLLAVVGRPAAEADAFAEAQVGSRLGFF